MGRQNEYHPILVNNTRFSDAPTLEFDPLMRSVLIINDGNSDIVVFSFNGKDIDGEIKPLDGEISFANVEIGRIWFKTNGTDAVNQVASFTPDYYDTFSGMVLVPDSVDLSSILSEDLFVDAAGNSFSIYGDIDNTAGAVIISSFTPSGYDINTGILSVPDSVNLSLVSKNHIFIDASSTPFVILGDIDNTLGQKQFLIESGASVNLNVGATINQWKHFKIANNQVVDTSVGAIINHPKGNELRVFAWA